ncbi:DUF2238 domain-containing protein [Pleionea litopenaei]|uniref:DUF2238 domain-containing protein n=1 Tax=Pleionea litopenaei TaxID=3070815 RepID=A0AA51RVB7_9GAMM|nr:DUF2238 domain-containing protein [Pleionea sp. HL-JVS1]WMS88175.1 DUF2238 domain-containing protein [Pleionea sp. HL-JVS1]
MQKEKVSLALVIWSLVFLVVFIWSAIGPKDYYTWALEVAPAVIGAIILLVTRSRFPLTTLLYVLILAHCLVLMVGGHYTYAEVPFGDWVKNVTGGDRNNYDKLGHLMQGLVPAVIARELLIRLSVVSSPAWRNLFILSICLGFSAFYELIEWWVALLSDEAAESFLGTQGYVWDTQSDMFWALIGASFSVIFLSRWHDHQIKRLS